MGKKQGRGKRPQLGTRWTPLAPPIAAVGEVRAAPEDALDSAYMGLEELSEESTAALLRELEGAPDAAARADAPADAERADADEEAAVVAEMRRRMQAQAESLAGAPTPTPVAKRAPKKKAKKAKRDADAAADATGHYDAAVQRAPGASLGFTLCRYTRVASIHMHACTRCLSVSFCVFVCACCFAAHAASLAFFDRYSLTCVCVCVRLGA